MAAMIEDFFHAITGIANAAMENASADQLVAIGNLLGHLGHACQALAAVKAAAGAAAAPAGVIAGPPDQLGEVASTADIPWPFAPAPPTPTPASAAPAPATALPRYAPPPDDVNCEEAHAQRSIPRHIENLRKDPVVFCERVFYYLMQIGAAEKNIPAEDPLLGATIDGLVLSIECLPGTRPLHRAGARPDEAMSDLAATQQVWTSCYEALKDFVSRRVLDHDDEATILHKLGDRPGGALAEPDYTAQPGADGAAPIAPVALEAVTQPTYAANDVPPMKDAAATAAAIAAVAAQNAEPPVVVELRPGAADVSPFASGLDALPPIPEVVVPPPPPPAPAGPPPPPVILNPGEVLVQPGQATSATLKDGTKVDLVNLLSIAVARTQRDLDAIARSLATAPDDDVVKKIFASAWRLER